MRKLWFESFLELPTHQWMTKKLYQRIGSEGSINRTWSSGKFTLEMHWRNECSHLDLKSKVTGGTKIRQWIQSNWRIFESNWYDIETQFDSNILQLLGIPGWILVLPVIQLFWTNWLHFFSVYRRSLKNEQV